MTMYTFSQARQQFARVLDKAKAEGQALIRRKDGSLFVIKPVLRRSSPLDVQGINVDVSAKEIVETIREARER